MMDNENGSEFGSGVVVCLAKFSQHLDSMRQWKETYIQIGKSEEYAISKAITMAMNAGSDHFYDLDKNKAPESLVKLADLTLSIGHGFKNETYTEETINEIFDLWKQACLDVDRMLGVEADWGHW